MNPRHNIYTLLTVFGSLSLIALICLGIAIVNVIKFLF